MCSQKWRKITWSRHWCNELLIFTLTLRTDSTRHHRVFVWATTIKKYSTEIYICWSFCLPMMKGIDWNHLPCTTYVPYNAYRMKTRNKGFGAPGYQIFDFKPFIFPLKNNKFWCVWRLERTSTCLITVFYHLANGRSDHFLYFVTDFCLMTFAMQIML